MPRLLIEYPDGDQKIIKIENSGSFFDKSRILWDERIDGPLPSDIEFGKMARSGESLVKLETLKPEYISLKQAKDQEAINGKIANLWAAADAYITAEINGVGLSILAGGVIQAKPKALAVAAWCDSIWAEYYSRKAAITAESDVNLDFSMFGEKPYTVLELREEISSMWMGV